MLTGFQAEVIAFMTDGDFVCVKHVKEQFPEVSEREDGDYWADIYDLEELSGYSAYSRYALDEQFPEGLWCGVCQTELIEPAEDYCTEHEGWYAGSAQVDGDDVKYCEYEDVNAVEAGAVTCQFPDTDPNPPAARWVPCSTCGAGDGESHDLTKHGAQPGWFRG